MRSDKHKRTNIVKYRVYISGKSMENLVNIIAGIIGDSGADEIE